MFERLYTKDVVEETKKIKMVSPLVAKANKLASERNEEEVRNYDKSIAFVISEMRKNKEDR